MFYVAACAALCFSAACRTSRGDGTRATASAIPAARQTLDVLIEEGDPASMEPRQYRYRCEVRDYMRTELPRRFARYGFAVRLLNNRAEHAPDSGVHLLVIRYDSYNPGSAAARMTVGFGAGAASLDLTATLYAAGAPALVWKEGCGTSGHWSRIVNKLDDNMAKKLRAHFAQR